MTLNPKKCLGMQGAQGQASQARAAAQEAEEQLRGQQERAEEAARQLEEAQSALALRDGTLQELTLENQRLQVHTHFVVSLPECFHKVVAQMRLHLQLKCKRQTCEVEWVWHFNCRECIIPA